MTQQYAPKKKPDALLVQILEWKSNDPSRPTRPAKFIAISDGDTVELTVWQDDKDQQDIREYLSSIDPQSLAGSTMLAMVRTPGTEFGGTMQYKLTGLKATGGDQPAAPAPTEAPVAAVQAPQATGYAPASRQEQGLALGNSKTGGSALVAAYVTANEGKLPDAEWLRQAAACVNTYSTDLLSGVTLEGLAEESGVTLEELVAEESLGVVSVDEVQHGN